MRTLFLAIIGVLLVCTLAAAAQAPAPKPGAQAAPGAKPWAPPKTPWGDPDLQGTYTSDDYIGVGLQRNPQFGNRLYLTEQEIAQREVVAVVNQVIEQPQLGCVVFFLGASR